MSLLAPASGASDHLLLGTTFLYHQQGCTKRHPSSAPLPCVASIIKAVIVIHTCDGSKDTVRSPNSIPGRNPECENGKGKLIYKNPKCDAPVFACFEIVALHGNAVEHCWLHSHRMQVGRSSLLAPSNTIRFSLFYDIEASLLLCELALITGCCVGSEFLDCSVDRIFAQA